jgi:regulator of protease activity HflC (stomatin/prohibitin superfamily)
MKKNLIMLAMSVLVALTFQGCYLTTVDSGEVGVQVTTGKVSDTPVTEGLAWTIIPLTDLELYNVKAKRLEMSGETDKQDTREVINDTSVSILTKDNLQIPVDITVLYKLKDACAPHIRKEFGRDGIWDNAVVVPVARSTVRDVIGKDADVYSLNQNREKYTQLISAELATRINAAIRKECVTVEMVSIRDIKLPKQLMDSIMAKTQMEEQSRTAELAVKRAEAEAKIEIAKKEGTAKAQLVLAKSITPELIKWKELEIQEEAIQKWDGKLPTTSMGNAIPFVNVK